MPTIIIDSREQRPYKFPSCETIIKCLPAGDYSLADHESSIAIERKSKQDAYGTIGKGRKCFVRELERLQDYQYACIVIECSMSEFLRPPFRSGLSSSSAINSLLAWSIRYHLPVFFCDTRLLAQTCTQRLLEKFWKEHQK